VVHTHASIASATAAREFIKRMKTLILLQFIHSFSEKAIKVGTKGKCSKTSKSPLEKIIVLQYRLCFPSSSSSSQSLHATKNCLPLLLLLLLAAVTLQSFFFTNFSSSCLLARLLALLCVCVCVYQKSV
jgi:hypothetical protein